MDAMDFDNPRLWIAVGIVATVAVASFLVLYFAPDARLERRRRKNNSRVVSTARRPMVKFSVRTPDEETKTKGK